MPKMIAPHGASWRGRALAAGETLDVTDAEAFQLAAHGFVLAEEAIDPAWDAEADVAALSRKDLLKLLRGQGWGNIFVKSTDELRTLAAKVLGAAPKMEARDGDQ